MLKQCILGLSLWVSTAAMAANTLHVYNWNDYLSADTIARFEKQCACKVVQDFYGDNEELLAKLAAGAKGYDIVVPTGFAVQSLIAQKKALPLGLSADTIKKTFNPLYIGAFFDQNNQYSIPYGMTTTVLGVNETALQKAGVLAHKNSWGLIFDVAMLSKIKGKVLVLDSQRELMAAALLYLKKDPNSTNTADWQAAAQVIAAAKPYWAAFNNQSYMKELAVGNQWVAMGYSSDLFQAKQDAIAAKRPFTVSVNLQKEGNTLSIDNFLILHNAPNPTLAKQFISFMMEPKQAAALSNELGIGTPNAAALAQVKPAIRAEQAVFPPANAALHQLRDLDVKSRRELNKLWSKIKLK